MHFVRARIKSTEIRTEVELDEFVVMPNHFHGIVMICPGDVGAYGHTPQLLSGTSPDTAFRSPSKTVGAMIRGFKSAVTKLINEKRQTPGNPVRQRNYYEHIIRDERSLRKIREYIVNNPMNWQVDEMNQWELQKGVVGKEMDILVRANGRSPQRKTSTPEKNRRPIAFKR